MIISRRQFISTLPLIVSTSILADKPLQEANKWIFYRPEDALLKQLTENPERTDFAKINPIQIGPTSILKADELDVSKKDIIESQEKRPKSMKDEIQKRLENLGWDEAEVFFYQRTAGIVDEAEFHSSSLEYCTLVDEFMRNHPAVKPIVPYMPKSPWQELKKGENFSAEYHGRRILGHSRIELTLAKGFNVKNRKESFTIPTAVHLAGGFTQFFSGENPEDFYIFCSMAGHDSLISPMAENLNTSIYRAGIRAHFPKKEDSPAMQEALEAFSVSASEHLLIELGEKEKIQGYKKTLQNIKATPHLADNTFAYYRLVPSARKYLEKNGLKNTFIHFLSSPVQYRNNLIELLK
ncbi:MAG: hypothetical protein AABW80_03080 [Nanoarchaeota archaeon]